MSAAFGTFIMGEFKTREAAQEYKTILESKGRSGISIRETEAK